MTFRFQIKESYKYLQLCVALIAAMWLTSLFEVIVSNTTNSHILLAAAIKLVNDFWCGIIIGALLAPVYILINGFSKKWSYTIIKILFTCIVIIQFSLVKYSLTTLLNLGADLLGYSLDDIFNTVSASESFSIAYFIPFIIFPALFLFLFRIINKYIPNNVLFGAGVLLVLISGSLKLALTNVSEAKFQNKIAFLTHDIIKFQKEKRQLSAYNLSNRNDYPLLKPFSTSKDVLSPFFNVKEKKPNIVVVIVEGLGSEFIGDKTYSGFTPYLDGLISKSLYWENFLSTTGRTFGVIPSLLGSLPFGETGFLELPKTPSHISLISVLKTNGYTTSYYSGDQSSFDKKINFFEYNDIDNVIDENKYGPEYIKTEANSGGFSWGYPDAEIFKKTLASLDGNQQPRLDIIMTLSNHEPFNFPNKTYYEKKVDSILNSTDNFNTPKDDIVEHKDIYTSLFYTDNSIKNFMNAYAKRDDYNNTIFIITGDHRLIPIAQKDKLCRFHVPLYIYSPMLKQPEKFKSVSSHWDVAPSLLSFLKANYKFNDIGETAWMGEGLDTTKAFRNTHKIPLMRYKGSINDFMYKDYLYSDGELYKVNENFGTYKVTEEAIIKTMADSLMAFKKMNAYVTQRNKIFPDSLNIYVKPSIDFSQEQLAMINTLTNGLNFDQTFEIARDKAFKKERDTARLLCDYILNELPNHSDARTLKGRTLAWDGDYATAELELLNVIKRSPYYYDSYLALLDLYWWSEQEEKSEAIYRQALKNNIANPNLGYKMAHTYKRLENTERANTIIDSLIKIHPNNSEYLTFKKTLQ
ncbi:sulfatase-like hydrolase/transferase [Snuella sedimenti]|uniref:Sulfatase-like hydrolase/transferase n=1 Tax=Snuella sedimenti TaxID=2798802 RepID=A0A8J7ITA9_9FLAO|nr:sulfatase-like hydrolase/transferase [Snuella sedimenti]MBJ6367580.1 sulfatase-like hydrolase/transferase [Snuella sedimenti]